MSVSAATSIHRTEEPAVPRPRSWLLIDPLLEFEIRNLERLGLALDFVLKCLHAQQRAHARKQFRLVDRLGKKIIGAGFDAMYALLRRIAESHGPA